MVEPRSFRSQMGTHLLIRQEKSDVLFTRIGLGCRIDGPHWFAASLWRPLRFVGVSCAPEGGFDLIP